uniref:Uncharacterized protein n=1 Tax=Romanomermis culicivorax TaxID=13658 RepID=A0A915JEM4_ROMCU
MPESIKAPAITYKVKVLPGCGLTHHTYLLPDCKVKDSKCYDRGHIGHFAKYCEQCQGKSNQSRDE